VAGPMTVDDGGSRMSAAGSTASLAEYDSSGRDKCLDSTTSGAGNNVIYIPNASSGSTSKQVGISNSGVGINASFSSAGAGATADTASLMVGNSNNTTSTTNIDPIATLKKTMVKKPIGKDPLIADDPEARGGKSAKKKGKKEKEGEAASSVPVDTRQDAEKEKEKDSLCAPAVTSGRPKKAKMKGAEGTKRASKESNRGKVRHSRLLCEFESSVSDSETEASAAAVTGSERATRGGSSTSTTRCAPSALMDPNTTDGSMMRGAGLEEDSDSDGGRPGVGLGLSGMSIASPSKVRRSTAMGAASSTAFHNSSYVGAMSPSTKTISKPQSLQTSTVSPMDASASVSVSTGGNTVRTGGVNSTATHVVRNCFMV
jgi:hypothetical protein